MSESNSQYYARMAAEFAELEKREAAELERMRGDAALAEHRAAEAELNHVAAEINAESFRGALVDHHKDAHLAGIKAREAAANPPTIPPMGSPDRHLYELASQFQGTPDHYFGMTAKGQALLAQVRAARSRFPDPGSMAPPPTPPPDTRTLDQRIRDSHAERETYLQANPNHRGMIGNQRRPIRKQP